MDCKFRKLGSKVFRTFYLFGPIFFGYPIVTEQSFSKISETFALVEGLVDDILDRTLFEPQKLLQFQWILTHIMNTPINANFVNFPPPK